MATNGNAELMQQIAKTLDTQPTPRPTADQKISSDDVVARVEAVSELVLEAGRYASNHGQYVDQISTTFAQRLQAMTSEYASQLLAAEERKMSELRKIMGKLAR